MPPKLSRCVLPVTFPVVTACSTRQDPDDVLPLELDGSMQPRSARRGKIIMRAIAMLACAASVACTSAGGTRKAPATGAGPAEGTYDYIANLPGQQVRGKLRIIGDTALIEPDADYCRPTVGTPDPLRIRYTCNGPGSFEQIQLFIDRRSPVQLSKWSATFRVQRRREVCVRYAIQNGRKVCVETRTETYETNESRSGTLQVRRLP